MSDIISQVWPEWHVEKMLGQGSYGKVYSAVRNGHGHTSHAAIKVMEIPQSPAEAADLASTGMDAASVRSYFEQRARNVLGEVALMEELKGAPNVVGVEDYQLVERESGVGWTVLVRMPLLEPAKEHFARVGQPDAREVARLGIDICRALSACHAKGVIHRDVKPENVFWGEYGYLLGDFGIARRLGPDAGSAHTRAGAFPYMAPEVFAGKGYGTDVDTYSLGLMMHRYLNNGRAPFLPTEGPFSPSDSERAVALRLAGRTIPAPVNADSTLSGIVMRACEADPDKRFGSAAEMGAALEAWLHGKTATPTPAAPTAVPAGPETVVLDQEPDEVTSQHVPPSTGRRAPQAAPSAAGMPQKSYGSSGTVMAGAPAQPQQAAARQPQGVPQPSQAAARQPQGAPQPQQARQTASAYPQGATTGATPSWNPQAAGAQQHHANAYSPAPAPAPMPQTGTTTHQPTTSPSGAAQSKSNNKTVLAIVAAVVIAGLLLITLFGMPIGCGSGSSSSDVTTSEPPADETRSNTGAESSSRSADGTLIDDEVCTMKVTTVSIDNEGDLRVDFTLTNHTDRGLEIHDRNSDDTGVWTVNGSEVDCVFATTIGPGETKDDYFFIEQESLPTSSLDEVYSMEGPVCVAEVTELTYSASIPDSPEHAADGFVGSRLIDDDVCTIEVTGTYFDSSGNLRVNATFANHTDDTLEVFDGGLWAVNGVYTEAIFADTVGPGETTDDYFFFEPDTIPTTNVDEIESLAGPLELTLSSEHFYDVAL